MLRKNIEQRFSCRDARHCFQAYPKILVRNSSSLKVCFRLDHHSKSSNQCIVRLTFILSCRLSDKMASALAIVTRIEKAIRIIL